MGRFLFIVLSLLTLVSCNKEIVFWDITPVGVIINLKDDKGNLVDPAYPNNILDSTVTATFMGESYTLTQITDEEISTSSTKAIIPVWYGFAIYDNKIYFGEFPGEENIEDQQLIIDWWGSSKDTITIRNIVHNTDSCWVDRSYHLNGKKVEYQFDIVK